MTRDEAVNALADAIRNPGPRPDIHAEIMRRHRQEWPTLWRAIDALLSPTPSSNSHRNCPVCGRWMVALPDGRLVRHLIGDDECSGSFSTPEDDEEER